MSVAPRGTTSPGAGATVPRCWPGETFVLLGGGPSLTADDVAACHDRRVRVIAVNDAFRLAPWADVLYACDAKWWDWHRGVTLFTGPKYALDPLVSQKWPDVQVLRNTGALGLELDPSGLRTGRNGGYQAINLAVHLGASRILLLGYDMCASPAGTTHWFGGHPDGVAPPYEVMRETFPSLVEPLAALGVTVVNCSRRTVLDVFPMGSLDDELARLEAA